MTPKNILCSALLLLCNCLYSQNVSIQSLGGTITDFFSADGNTINIVDGGFGDVIKHIGRDVDGMTRPQRYVAYKYANGLVITRQYDGTVTIDFNGTISINDAIDLSGLTDACLIINAHQGNININANIITNTSIPGKGGAVIMNSTSGAINCNATINSNDGNIILGSLSFVNSGNIQNNDQHIFIEIDECADNSFTNTGVIDAGTGTVLTPLPEGNIVGNVVANIGFDVMGITDDNLELDQTLTITSLTDTEFALDGGPTMAIPANGEVSTDGSTISILSDKCVAILIDEDVTLDRDLVIVTPGNVLTTDDIIAEGHKISIFSGTVDVADFQIGLEGQIEILAHTLIRSANIEAEVDSDDGFDHPVESRISLLSLGQIEALFNDSGSEEFNAEGIGSSINVVASGDLTMIPEDESDAIHVDSENSMASIISYEDLSMINSQLEGLNDGFGEPLGLRGAKILLFGRNKIEVLDGENNIDVNENGYLLSISSGITNFTIDGISGNDSSSLTILSKNHFVMQIDDSFDFNNGNIFICSGGCIKSQNQLPHIDIENGIFTAIAEEDIRIISSNSIDGSGGINEGALLQFYAGDEITINDYDIEGTPDGTIIFNPTIQVKGENLPSEFRFPVNITRRELFNFNITTNPGTYDVDNDNGFITIPNSASDGDQLIVTYEDGDGGMYTTTIEISIQNPAPQTFPGSGNSVSISGESNISDFFSSNGSLMNFDNNGFGPACRHIGYEVDGILRPMRYVTYSFENKLVVSRQYDGSVLIDYAEGDLSIDTDIDLTGLYDANIIINVHNGNLIINSDINVSTTHVQKGGSIVLNATNGEIVNNATLSSEGGHISLGAKKVSNEGLISVDGQSILIHTDPIISDAFSNNGTIDAGSTGTIISQAIEGITTGNIISADGSFSVNGITEADKDLNNSLNITYLDDTQFELNAGGNMPIPGSGEVSTDGTTIFIRTGKAVKIESGATINLTKNLEIVTPRSIIVSDEIDGSQIDVSMHGEQIFVRGISLNNSGGGIDIYSRRNIEFGNFKIDGTETDPGGHVSAFALENIEAYNPFNENKIIELDGLHSSVNFNSGRHIYFILDGNGGGIEIDGENTALQLIAYDKMVLLDTDLDMNDDSDRRGSSIILLGRNLNEYTDTNEDLEIEDNGYLLFLSSNDMNFAGYGMDGDALSAATFITPGYFSSDNDDDITMDNGEFFIQAGGDIKIQTTDSDIRIEAGNFTAIASGKVIIIGDEDIDYYDSESMNNGQVIIKSGENIVISDFDNGGTNELIDFRPQIVVSCLPGPHKVPFPIEINEREFDNFSLVGAPPGFSIDPNTGTIVIPEDARMGDPIVVSFEDDSGQRYTVRIGLDGNLLASIPTLGNWAFIILSMLIFVVGVVRLKSYRINLTS